WTQLDFLCCEKGQEESCFFSFCRDVLYSLGFLFVFTLVFFCDKKAVEDASMLLFFFVEIVDVVFFGSQDRNLGNTFWNCLDWRRLIRERDKEQLPFCVDLCVIGDKP
ncbi:MAG: uncharacterized protein A8A55_3669, partial [Amphiamblys sp. WSBS2006]